jgi:hypothetical protein
MYPSVHPPSLGVTRCGVTIVITMVGHGDVITMTTTLGRGDVITMITMLGHGDVITIVTRRDLITIAIPAITTMRMRNGTSGTG